MRNERSLGVKNGSLGTIETIRDGVLEVKLDAAGNCVVVDTKFYRDLDYGYAATVYKAQGATVDRTYVLATSHHDRHATYVALSRHRHSAEVFYAAEDFQVPWARKGLSPGDELSPAEARQRFLDVLSRARPKELRTTISTATRRSRWRPWKPLSNAPPSSGSGSTTPGSSESPTELVPTTIPRPRSTRQTSVYSR